MCALILERFGDMSANDMYELLKANSIDLGDSGHDTYYGWGVPMMPNVNEKTKVVIRIGAGFYDGEWHC